MTIRLSLSPLGIALAGAIAMAGCSDSAEPAPEASYTVDIFYSVQGSAVYAFQMPRPGVGDGAWYVGTYAVDQNGNDAGMGTDIVEVSGSGSTSGVVAHVDDFVNQLAVTPDQINLIGDGLTALSLQSGNEVGRLPILTPASLALSVDGRSVYAQYAGQLYRLPTNIEWQTTNSLYGDEWKFWDTSADWAQWQEKILGVTADWLYVTTGNGVYRVSTDIPYTESGLGVAESQILYAFNTNQVPGAIDVRGQYVYWFDYTVDPGQSLDPSTVTSSTLHRMSLDGTDAESLLKEDGWATEITVMDGRVCWALRGIRCAADGAWDDVLQVVTGGAGYLRTDGLTLFFAAGGQLRRLRFEP